jgi:hypothetical protein
MGKNTNILIGAGALAVVYYLYNASKSSTSVSPSSKTPISPSALTEVKSDEKTLEALKAQLAILQSNPNNYNSRPIGDVLLKVERGGLPPEPTIKEIEEGKRLAEIKAYEEENARQEAMRLANQIAYEEENARLDAARFKENERQKAYLAEVELTRLKNEADAKAAEAAREKAMNAFMYPTCPDGFEFYQNNCMPTYLIVEEKAKKGEGLVLRDFKSNTTTLVQTCPSEYVKQGINCIPRYSLSPQALQVLAMEESGMVQTSDGQWYTNAASAAAAQAIIDAQATQYGGRGYSARQNSINEAICSVNRDGYINNPNSSTNGMSLSQYIGQFKVTANELGIARASCPNSVYSSNLIAGGRTDDNALGYK